LHAVVILNTHSACGGQAEGGVRRAAEARGVRVETTDDGIDLGEVAGRAAEDGVERVVVAGGDGTINAAINGLMRAGGGPELAILPCGTANDFANCVGLDVSGGWEQATHEALEMASRACDVVRVESDDRDTRYFLNVSTGGVGGRVSDRVSPEHKQRFGSLAYWVTGTMELAGIEPYKAEIDIDGESIEADVFQLAVANGRTMGGGFPVSPGALLDDGRVDVVVAPEQTFLNIIGTMTAMSFGRHESSQHLMVHQAERVRICATPPMSWSMDGELFEPGSCVSMEVCRHAVRLAAPARSPAFAPTDGDHA